MSRCGLENLNSLLQELIVLQKAKYEVKSTLAAIVVALEADSVSVSLSDGEWSNCVAATLLALRVAAGLSMGTGTWKRDRVGYASIVNTCIIGLEFRNCSTNLADRIKFGSIHPLLSALVSDVEGDSVTVYSLLQAVHGVINIISSSDLLIKDLISLNHVGLYGKLVSVCLEILSNKEKDFRCRESALKSLEVLVDACEEQSSTLCIVLPGLLTALVNTASDAAGENLSVITRCLKILSKAVRYCLSDSVDFNVEDPSLLEVDSTIRELYVKRDPEWRSAAGANITKMVRLLSSNLAAHRDEEVRRVLLETVYAIREKCKGTFKETLDVYLMDLLITNPGSTSTKESIIGKLRADNLSSFVLHMHEKLRELAERLPLHVQKGLSGTELLFQQLLGVLSCLSADLHQLACSRSPTIRSVITTIGASLQVNERRLLISRGVATESVAEFLKTLPLCHDVDICSVLPVCKLLAVHGGSEMTLAEMMNNNESGRASMALLATLLLIEMDEATDSYILFSLIETCVEWLKESRPTRQCRDEVIEHSISAPNRGTVLKITLLLVSGVAFTRIKEKKKQQKLLVVFLYQLLNLYMLREWIVHDAVDCALSEVARAMELSVSELLYEHGSYLVNRVAVATRSPQERIYAPVVLSALLDKVDDPRMYGDVRHIVDDLLMALDRSMQDYCILILRSMVSFVNAVQRWFPELKPEEEDLTGPDDEDLRSEEEAIVESAKVENLPQPILSVEGVLLRTKHLLSSPHFPIRLLTMKILRAGLWVLRNFDNQLLPMVHQNWETLINRFSDSELEVRMEAIGVVAQMVSVSKTFVYRRVRHQLWPILEKWIIKDRYQTFPSGSLSYKLIQLLLQSIASMWIGIDASADDVELVVAALELVQNQTKSVQLKTEAASACHLLQQFVEMKEKSKSDNLS
ncbi:hypothetical protein Q1695_005684 [Nippostrongylus brasiliensis]|nr:hypothetical protein Q1695_005684 [Nippostrongylus brasiliensis]